MVQIIKNPNNELGAMLGKNLGTGLSALANQKLGELQQRQQQQKLRSGLEAFGQNPNMADLGPELLKPILQERAKEQAKTLVNNNNAKLFKQVNPNLTDLEANFLAQQPADLQFDLYNAYKADQESRYSQQPKPQGYGSEEAEGVGSLETPSEQLLKEEALITKPKTIKQQGLQEKAQTEGKMTTAQRVAEERKMKAAKKAQSADQFKIDKQTQKFYDASLEAEKAASSGDLRLNRMEQIIKEGGTPTAVFYRLFKSTADSDIGKHIPFIGHLGDIPIKLFGAVGQTTQKLLHRDVEEFEKLSADFVKDAKKYFGNRLTDTDLEHFMRTIPTLLQTDKGKLAMINNMRAFMDLAHKEYAIMDEIIRENGGERPKNLELEVNRRMSPYKDEISKLFTQGYQR